MTKLFYIVVIIPHMIYAQQKGIQFEQKLSWKQVQEKANAEGKYIFVDCFATWCGPCKTMDKNVFPLEKVGDYINAKFISVKLQMDTSKQDNGKIRTRYADARFMMQQYKINAFPSFLFFSPGGRIVHRGLGLKNVDDFITLASAACDSKKQYYTLLENYQQGKKEYAIMPYLANLARTIGDQNMSNSIAQDYINNYLMKLKEEELYTKENIEFISSFIQSSKGKSFSLFYKQPCKIDKLMNRKEFSQCVVDYIITKEEIDPKLWRNSNPKTPFRNSPNWNRITSIISKKFNSDYAERIVLNAKLKWLEYKKDWLEYSKNVVWKVEKYGPYEKYAPSYVIFSVDWKFNANAWDLFQHCTDTSVLTKALAWCDSAIKITPGPNVEYFDTYANLLYKMGRIRDAITEEENAVKLEEENAAKDKRIPDKVYSETLTKIRKGEQTWPKQ
ncbi:MAG TPA: thioredoxin fold domain-containing protein [Puia sp.]|nr:thioredoxin fold domain-containing protein [Puia sp.]